MHNACMTTITVRNVPEETHAELVERARLHNQSLQEFLLSELKSLAQRTDIAAWAARVRERKARTDTALDIDQILANKDADKR